MPRARVHHHGFTRLENLSPSQWRGRVLRSDDAVMINRKVLDTVRELAGFLATLPEERSPRNVWDIGAGGIQGGITVKRACSWIRQFCEDETFTLNTGWDTHVFDEDIAARVMQSLLRQDRPRKWQWKRTRLRI